MVGIGIDDEEVILENRLCFLKGNAMLLTVVGSLLGVPLESHGVIID